MTEAPKEAARRFAESMIKNGFEPVALHTYTDAERKPIYWRIRLKHPDTGDKWIRPMKLNGQGYELAEPIQCPSCRHGVPKDAVLCINCGHNFRTGKKHRRKVDEWEVANNSGGINYRIRRDERGHWTLTLETRILGFWKTNQTFDLDRYRCFVAVYQHDGWDDNEGEVAIYLESPTGKREREFFKFRQSLC